METRSRSAPASNAAPAGARVAVSVLSALVACALSACQTPSAAPASMAASPVPSDPQSLAVDLDARLDALQRQSEPASDDVINALERTLRVQREKRARAVVAAGTTAVIPAGGERVAAAQGAVAPPRVSAAVPVPPARQVKLSRAATRAAAASAAAASKAAKATANASPDKVGANAAATRAAAPTSRPAEVYIPAPALVHSTAATVMGAPRTPMSRTAESRLPVDELYDRARALEVQLQTNDAISLYREASQRGHALSSRRLMELYADGAPGVERDYRVAVFFKERAVQQGVSFDSMWRR